jgi:catechol 2,3-dioxygenase-like lactoylglutathione lyase family enzyme
MSDTTQSYRKDYPEAPAPGEILEMPGGIGHVKLVTPDPAAVNDFLANIAGFPGSQAVETLGGQGPLGMFGVGQPPSEPHPPHDDGSGDLPLEQVYTTRGADGTGGYMIGDLMKRSTIQMYHGEEPHIWSVMIAAPDIEGAHAKCVEQGIPVSDIHVVTPLGTDLRCRFMFARVGGIVFELMRLETAPE